MEATPTSPLLPPVRPFAARERSGSSSSKGSDGGSSAASLILPGLKDAVKVATTVYYLIVRSCRSRCLPLRRSTSLV